LGAKWQKIRIGRSSALVTEQQGSPVQWAEGSSSLFPSGDG